MKIWKLSPRDLNSVHWSFSSYKGDAIVRAENEKEARYIAVLRFLSLSTKNGPCQETPRSPWDNSSVVKCIEFNDSDYSTDGPTGLLEPEGFDM